MIRKIEKYMRQQNMVDNGDVIVVGVSGGADSVCLLDVLKNLQDKMDFTLKAVHVNHMIRGEEADADENYVKSLCNRLDIPLHCVKIDVPGMAKEMGESLETAGRQLRYETFEAEPGMTKIAVAHHKNDQAETVLFHMARGSSIHGMSGIRPVRGQIIHPLLCVTREEIEQYLQERELEYCTDSTNLSNEYSRNRIRNQILPSMAECVNDRVVDNISELAEQMSEAYDYIHSQAVMLYEQVASCDAESVFFDAEQLKMQPSILRREMILLAINELAGTQKNISKVHLEQVDALLDMQVSSVSCLPYGIQAMREYQGIRIALGKEHPDAHKADDNSGLFYGQEEIFSIQREDFEIEQIIFDGNWENVSNDYTKVFDYDKIKDKLSIRKRLPGDYIMLDSHNASQENSTGKKKSLKSFMIDQKIPQKDRDSIWVVAENSHVLWIVGQRISAYYKTNKETKNGLLVKIRRK